ncbi:MAG: glutamate-5-semialdehyde dehydrogenase [Chloroflexota bacterium]|nr:glutamate-5-semialdehyde dehydrogenase [Chloroflexota bacterium]MDE2885881.1 glutamate-5-semialdehyde dehydrogenase [Chloroflexota bacterium]
MTTGTATSELITKAQAAREASKRVRMLSTEQKNDALRAIADALEANCPTILEANARDLEAGREAGLSEALQGRLLLNEQRVAGMANDVRGVALLPDPVGECFDSRTLPNGIRVERRRVPLGVIGCVYEARPNVTTDIVSLCLKSGNAVVLRGGKEAVHTNTAVAALVKDALEAAHAVPEAVQFVTDTDRAIVDQMIRLNDYLDLFIPRGGEALIKYVRDNATVPAITGGVGVVHVYVDAAADPEKASGIVYNAKTQRPDVCNALDTLLVHAAAAPTFLPGTASRLTEAGVELRCDQRALSLIGPVRESQVRAAGPDDFGQEFLALTMSVKVVDSMDDALEHIEEYGSGHTEAIVTEDYSAAMRFTDEVEASVVLVNASTRFNDGAQLGLGSEVAISTNKLHARGPMGLRELTSYKWIALGDGQVRP